MVEYLEILLVYLDCSFIESISLKVVGSRAVRVNVELGVELFEELWGQLWITV